MKIETQPREDHQVQVIAEFEPETMQDYKRRAAKKIAKNTKIPGFRPGKAPFDVVKRYFGEEAIEKEAIELLIDDVYPNVLKEANITPSGPGSLEDILSTEPPKFSFIVPLQPEVILPDYHTIRKEYKPEKVTKKEVDQAIENLRMSYATAEPVDRPVQEGDLVYLKLKGRLVKPDEGEDPDFIHESPLQVIAGKSANEEEEWPFEGFSKEVIGLSANEEKTIVYTYPKKSPLESLRGKKAEFTFSIQNVKAMKLPELDEEFLQSLGDFESAEKLRETVQESLEAQRANEYDQKYFNELIDAIVDQSTTRYPPNVLADEVEHILEHLKEDLAQQKMDLETYLKARNLEKDVFIENEVKPAAIKRLKRSLVMDELARAENIQISREELQNAVAQTIAQMSNEIDLSAVKTNLARKNFTTAVTYETAGRLLNQHIKDRLKAIATGEFQAEKEQETSGSTEEVEAAAPKTRKASAKSKKAAAETKEEPHPKPEKKSKKTGSETTEV
ncbi:MAG: trigger factor [Anaerolineae bacterium]|nr:trigger factor [Anaerolineae bacterium]